MFATVHSYSVICTLLAQLVLSNSLLDVSHHGGENHSDSSYFTTSSHQQNRFLLPTESFMTNSKVTQNKSASNGTKLAPLLMTPSAGNHEWSRRSVDSFDFNRDYFHQMNALNHKPMQAFSSQESHPKPSISAPSEIESHGRSQENIFYYTPSSYGKSVITSSSKNTDSQLATYLNRFNTTKNYWPPAPSGDKTGSLNSVDIQSNHGISANQASDKPVQWSIPVGEDKPETNGRKASDRIDYQSSYSGELNKLLLQKYYNRDLSAMTALLGKHPSVEISTNSDTTRKQISDSPADDANDEEDEESDDEEESGDDNSEKPIEGVSVVKTVVKPESEYKTPKMNLLGEYKGRSGETVLRVHSPRVVRPYTSGGRPVRLQGAHSHAMPHYYMPHGTEGGGHHHLVSEKSSTWLGSGLAAGILIGAIPFGIMMASMMPTLLTTAMPIVNTATMAGKRRRRSAEIKNLFMEQTLDTLGAFLRKGIEDVVSSLKEPNIYSSKNDVHEYLDKNSQNDVLKTVARYAIASVDEPKCIKEMVCALVAGGRHSQTTSLQKTLYVMTKWIPKDIERSLGLNGLFNAIRKDACFSTYKCPITVIDGMRKRSSTSSTFTNARKMT